MNAIIKQKIIVAVLLAVLVVSFAVSGGVFAKYVSTSNANSNQARIAKWGLDVSVDATNILGSAYKGEGIDIDANSNSLTVSAGENVQSLLPGASGSMNITIDGTSEVLAKLTVDIGGSEIFLQKDAEIYYPIVWTLKKGSEVLVSGRLDDIDAYFADNPETGDVNELEVSPNTHSAFEGEYVLSWTWEFSNASSNITDLSVNEADTLIGFAAIDEENRTDAQASALQGYTAQTMLWISVSIVVEQIQK